MKEFLSNFLIDFFLIFAPIFSIAKIHNKKSIKEVLAELGIEKTEKKFFFKKTIALFLILIAVSMAISIILTAFGLNDTQNVFKAIDSIKQKSIFLLLYLLIVRVTAEEIFFRGFLAKKIGIIPSSAIFAIAHIFYNSTAEIIGAFFLGIVLAQQFIKNKNLLPNIFAHIFYNFFILLVAYSI